MHEVATAEEVHHKEESLRILEGSVQACQEPGGWPEIISCDLWSQCFYHLDPFHDLWVFMWSWFLKIWGRKGILSHVRRWAVLSGTQICKNLSFCQSLLILAHFWSTPFSILFFCCCHHLHCLLPRAKTSLSSIVMSMSSFSMITCL